MRNSGRGAVTAEARGARLHGRRLGGQEAPGPSARAGGVAGPAAGAAAAAACRRTPVFGRM